MPKRFVHLHVHSEFSLLDGLSKISALITKTKEHGSTALGLTDHGVMYGAIEFYKKAVKEEIKPILGCEIYMSSEDHTEKKRKDAYHLTVLARNYEGYQNLLKIITIGQIDGYYYRPRVDMKILEKYSKGLLATTGCPAGLVQQQLQSEGYDTAKKTTADLACVFEPGHFYIELQRHPFDEFAKNPSVPADIRDELKSLAKNQRDNEKNLVKISRELGLPLVATNDVHYVNKEDAVAQDAIVCIQTGKVVADTKRMRYIDTPTFYLKTPEEMHAVFADLPEALENTQKIADQCSLEITLGQWFFPKFDLPAGKTAGEALKDKAYSGCKEIYGSISEEQKQRLDYELDIIDSKGFSPYFLIYSDMTRHAKDTGIFVNTRGSAAGSFVSYCCGITVVDPLRYQLPFERFLNPFRPSPPDIDLDISDDRRDDMIAYLKQKYGEDKVAQICTFGTMQARGSVRDVGRVLGYPYAIPDRISKMIPMGSQGFKMSIKRALNESPELKAAYTSEDDTKKIIDLAQKIEGNARHVSVHAAAVVVAPDTLTCYSPLQREPGGGDKIITQYEMHACEDVGLIKLDILGIRNLSIMANAIRIIKKLRRVKIDIHKIPLDDEKTFAMLARGETFGVFQMGSAGMTRYLMDLHPERVEDLMQMVALYRPGPMSFIPDYIKRKHDPSLITYMDPRMETFLSSSYGILVYQDDVLYCALELAGYDWGEADKFRKAIGKKIPAEMEAQHERFVTGCVAEGMTKEKAEELFKQIETFAAYGFNKAHAASYGMVSYWTAYLKANYPAEYMSALLTAESGNTDKLVEAIAECGRMGIPILPPDINTSLTGFTIVDVKQADDTVKQTIRFGLSAIKNVGNAAVDAILKARQDGPFKSFTDFCHRCDQQKCNKKVLDSLIKAGALDAFGHRAALLAALETVRSKASASQKSRSHGQTGLFEDKDSAAVEDNLPEVEELPLKQQLVYERELLGFFLTDNPVRSVMKKADRVITHRINQLDPVHHLGQTITVAGCIARLRQVYTKKDNSAMAFGTLEDDTGSLDVVFFPKTYADVKEKIQPDSAVILKGKLDKREEALNLMVNEVRLVDDLHDLPADWGPPPDKEVKELFIPRGTPKEKLQQLNNLLKQHLGDDQLVIVIPNGGEPKRILLPYTVSFTPELETKIKALL